MGMFRRSGLTRIAAEEPVILLDFVRDNDLWNQAAGADMAQLVNPPMKDQNSSDSRRVVKKSRIDRLPEGSEAQSSIPALTTGRYLADNGRWSVELRLQVGEPVIFSADLITRTRSGTLDLGVRTDPLVPDHDLAPGELVTIAARWLDGEGNQASGQVGVRPIDSARVEATFVIDASLGELPEGFTLSVIAARISTALRDIGLETEQESGVEVHLEDPTRSEATNLVSVLSRAGIDVHVVGSDTEIPVPLNGLWSGSDVFSTLHELLQSTAQSPLTTPAWETHLLLLSRTERPGLLGVMFDYLDDLPRQGAAVFVEEVRRRFPEEVERRVLATAVHELGHCLNLTHRYSLEVGRIDSLSVMNYDWVYGGGNKSDEYWKHFDYGFDEDELDFLRHGPRNEVIPGGAPFGSARYWLTGPRGLRPAIERVPGLQLWLTPPRTGTGFAYGQPVFLEISLRNSSEITHCLPRQALDIKAGMLEILVQKRRRRGPVRPSETRSFEPFMRRCFDVSAPERVALHTGESLHDNLNLTFGSGGFPLAEPGDYLVKPILTLVDASNEAAYGVVEGGALPISIAPPQSAAERRDAAVMFRNDVGASLALGGADVLTSAALELQEVVDRRRFDGRVGGPDGLVAASTRMLGIHAARRGNRREAARLLDLALLPGAVATFDPHTAEATLQLARRQVGDVRRASSAVYVDLGSHVSSGAIRDLTPLHGVLLSRPAESGALGRAAEGIAILVDASDVSDDDLATASAVLAGADGLLERVAITSLHRFSDSIDVSGRMALAVLARTVPTNASTPIDLARLWREEGQTEDGVRQVLAEAGITVPVAEPDGASESALLQEPVFPTAVAAATPAAPWAPWASTGRVAEMQARIVANRWPEVASFWCYLSRRCNEAPDDSETASNPHIDGLAHPSIGCRAAAQIIGDGAGARATT
jgi:hypothetical protein